MFVVQINTIHENNFFNEKQFNNTQLFLLGEGVEETICRKKANNNPNIIFLGFRNTPEKYYQIADYVISTSSAEGYPMSILEVHETSRENGHGLG